jgi:hypothetical protein
MALIKGLGRQAFSGEKILLLLILAVRLSLGLIGSDWASPCLPDEHTIMKAADIPFLV